MLDEKPERIFEIRRKIWIIKHRHKYSKRERETWCAIYEGQREQIDTETRTNDNMKEDRYNNHDKTMSKSSNNTNHNNDDDRKVAITMPIVLNCKKAKHNITSIN